MNWRHVLILLSLACSGCSVVRTTISPVAELKPARTPARFDHSDWTRILQKFVDDNGKVDYRQLALAPEDLERYYAQVAAFSPDSHPDMFPAAKDKLSYWINAYNATAMITVLRYYPITSVGDIPAPPFFGWLSPQGGFFIFQALQYGGATTNFYYLENKVIRVRFPDPRTHFALNCASLSCPRLPRTAFTPEDLDRQLDREASRFCNEERNVRIDHDRKKILLSPIFQWFEEEFVTHYRNRTGKSEADLIDSLSPYLSEKRHDELQRHRAAYTIEYRAYDWGLNDASPAAQPSDP